MGIFTDAALFLYRRVQQFEVVLPTITTDAVGPLENTGRQASVLKTQVAFEVWKLCDLRCRKKAFAAAGLPLLAAGF